MTAIILNNDEINNLEIFISGEKHHYLTRVVRIKKGDVINCLHNQKLYDANILEINPRYLKAEIINEKSYNVEPNMNLTLYQSLLKRENFEIVIQKTTELGIKRIVPIVTSRTVITNPAINKLNRWQKIAESATLQSGRAVVPEVSDILDIKGLISAISEHDKVFMFYEKLDVLRCSVKPKLLNKKNIGIIIGPEGGFSPAEVEELRGQRVEFMTLGPRILRAETAAITAVSIIMYECGEI